MGLCAWARLPDPQAPTRNNPCLFLTLTLSGAVGRQRQARVRHRQAQAGSGVSSGGSFPVVPPDSYLPEPGIALVCHVPPYFPQVSSRPYFKCFVSSPDRFSSFSSFSTQTFPSFHSFSAQLKLLALLSTSVSLTDRPITTPFFRQRRPSIQRQLILTLVSPRQTTFLDQ